MPRGPRIIFTASIRFMSWVDLQVLSVPSGQTATIWSLALMPASAAGVPSIGETTVTKPSALSPSPLLISMPSPSNSPFVSRCTSLYMSFDM